MSKRLVFIALAGLCWVAAISTAHAQQRHAEFADEVFDPSVRDLVHRQDKSIAIQTRRVADRRIDATSGVIRAEYNIDSRAVPGQTPLASAERYLSGVRDAFGLDDAGTLEVVSTRSTKHSHHVLFQQHVNGIPVYGRFVKVNLDESFRPTMTLNGVQPGLGRALVPRGSVSASEAKSVVGAVVAGGVSASEPELMVYPSEPPVIVWRMLVWPSAVPGEWEVLVNASNSKVVQILDRASHRVSGSFAAGSYERSMPDVRSYEVVSSVDGSGFAFDPDPLTTSGSAYAPPYVDNGDGPTPELEAERILVALRDISQDNEGLYRLDGPFVRVVGGGSIGFQPPGEVSPIGFQYSRSQPGFEAVGAYYHLDKSQRYVQSLGFTDLQNAPILVNPRSSAVDNSFYTPGQNFLEFGTGGVDDAEDAGVMWHEYAHALLEAGSPGLSIDGEGQALHEGWADYWAGSYMRFLADSQTGKRTDWENVFRWDSGDGQIWPGRSLTRSGVYPDNTTCDDPNDVNGDGCAIHSDGLLWATTLMEIYSDIGKNTLDRLVLQSHAYLSPPTTFVDAAEALIQADRDINGGVNTSALISNLSARGYLDASTFGPVVSHVPLRSTEQLGQTVEVQARAISTAAPIQSVVIRHRRQGESSFETVVLENIGSDDYEAEITLPLTPATIEYYVEAVDDNALQSRLPANAPTSLFEFEVGPDTQEPVITHIPISSASNALWPVPVVTFVEDNLAVDSVWVNFAIEDADGVAYLTGSFGLALVGAEYRAAFPVSIGELRVGSRVRYSVTARDAAIAGNTATVPQSGNYNFPIVFSGVLASFDFEQSGGDLVGTGVWERGSPQSTLKVAHSGSAAWGTDIDGAYPAFAQLSSLTMPEFNLAGISSAYLVFWHWYDFEYRGSASPGGSVEGSIWDGGNVKISTDGGATWSVVVPEGGYSGVVANSATNPLSGEQAFGAYSFGWRQEIIPMPTQDGVEVRFDFGTDESNEEQSVGYGGWFIDDITLVTEQPIDVTSPVIVASPPPLTLKAVGQALPRVEATITDDTGVSSVYVEYVIVGSSPGSGTLPLAMALDNLTMFAGDLPAGTQFQAGDRFEYRLRITDFAGNTTFGPPAGQDRLAVEFRAVAGTNVLRNVVATGQWIRDLNSWSTVSGDATTMSSLVLPPTTLAEGTEDVWLQLEHSYEVQEGLGGNVSLSVDDGRNWSVIDPEVGYPARLSSGGHPMNGQDIFSGSSGGPTTSLFDLTAHAGKLAHLRIDFGATRSWDAAERWTIMDAFVFASSLQPEIEIPDKLSLSSNYPDPFSGQTTIRFTLPESMHVRMDVVNVMGQLVALLSNGVREKGTHTITFDGSGLASGLYVLVMDAGGERKSERMVIVR